MAGRVYDDRGEQDTVWDVEHDEWRADSLRDLEPHPLNTSLEPSPWDHAPVGGFEGDDFARAMWGQR